MELEKLKAYYDTQKSATNDFLNVVRNEMVLEELNNPDSPLTKFVSTNNIPRNMDDLITILDGLRGTCDMNIILKWVGDNVRLDSCFLRHFVDRNNIKSASLIEYLFMNYEDDVKYYLRNAYDISDLVEFK